jgi:NADPH:quinone reductase-like Zn-dependent oxidoreductase
MGPHPRDRVKVGRVPVRLDLMHAGVIPTTGLTALHGVDDALHPATARRFSRGCIDAALALAGGDALERCLHAARPGGRVAYPNGVEPEPRPRENIKVISYDAISGVRQFERLGPAIEAASSKSRSPHPTHSPKLHGPTSASPRGMSWGRSCFGSAEEVDQWR